MKTSRAAATGAAMALQYGPISPEVAFKIYNGEIDPRYELPEKRFGFLSTRLKCHLVNRSSDPPSPHNVHYDLKEPLKMPSFAIRSKSFLAVAVQVRLVVQIVDWPIKLNWQQFTFPNKERVVLATPPGAVLFLGSPCLSSTTFIFGPDGVLLAHLSAQVHTPFPQEMKEYFQPSSM